MNTTQKIDAINQLAEGLRDLLCAMGMIGADERPDGPALAGLAKQAAADLRGQRPADAA